MNYTRSHMTTIINHNSHSQWNIDLMFYADQLLQINND
jgi:hypothetical protein